MVVRRIENKKVKNATQKEYDGIAFKSLSEYSAYKLFKEAGLNPDYEPDKTVIMEGFKPSIVFFKPLKINGKKTLGPTFTKVIDVTYTPDFIIKGNTHTYYIEIKGFKTDSYNIKVKLFRKWLESQPNSVFFELHSKKDILTAIEIIKDHEKNSTITKDIT